MSEKPTYEELERRVKELERAFSESRKVLESLPGREERCRAILEGIEDSYLEVDLRGNFRFFNDAFCRLLGYARDELLGTNSGQYLDQVNAEKVFRIFYDLYKTKKSATRADWEIVRKDGTKRTIEASVSLITDSQGSPQGFRGIGRDVTNYLIAEERLKQSFEITEKIIENIPIGMVIVGKDKIIQRINRAGLEIAGRDSDKGIVGRPCYENLCPAEKGKCPIMDLGQSVNKSEKAVIHEDGRHIPVYKTAIPVLIGDEEVILEAFMDISELKEAECALHETTERLHTVMDTIADPLVVYNDRGQTTYVNPAFSHVFGWTSEELIGHRIDFVPEELMSETRAAIKGILNGERLTGYETQRYAKDGRRIDVRLGAALLKGATGQPAGIVVNFQDITTERQAREELKEINQELEAAIERANAMAVEAELASAAKSEFLANMSHEIRTPMNGVIGMTELLLDTPLTQEQRNYAGIVRSSGEALLSLINDILDFSKIEAGKLELEILNFDLLSLIEDFAASMAVRAHEKGLELISSVDPTVPTLLKGDPGRLRQVLTNLVGNALKFTREGEVTIIASLETETPTDAILRFSVRDTGIGIPDDKVHMLFEKFTQVDASTTRQFGGTGLGLAISKQLAEMMGGDIGVETQEGIGSEFWFTARMDKQPESVRKETMLPADLHGVKVLVVDDNLTSRKILNRRMISWGMRVFEAEDGPGALQSLYGALQEKDPFQVAVIDMQMPGMDGEALGRVIQSDRSLAATRMVMMTSMGSRGDARLFEEAGFAAFMTKPVRHEELKGALSLALGDRQGSEQDRRPIVTRHTVRETSRRPKKTKARILLAEDNITNQQVALGILRKLGLEADAVADGAEALKSLESIPYDLVLMDIQMPVMDGLEATRRIRSRESGVGSQSNQQPGTSNQQRSSSIPIIAMTAHAMQGDRERCLEAGMNDYVSKPVSFQSLSHVLEKWLPQKDVASGSESSDRNIQQEAPTINNQQLTTDNPNVWDRPAMMERMMGDEDLAKMVVETFLSDIPNRIESLRERVENEDMQGVRSQAHTIKGAAANMCADALREVAFEMEQAAAAGNLSSVRADMDRLLREFDRVKQIMKEVQRR